MKKALLVFLITVLTIQLTFSQIGYGYTGDKRANIDDWSKMVKEYRNNEQRALDESEFDKLIDRVRMLDNDMIRLDQKINTIIEIHEKQKRKKSCKK